MLALSDRQASAPNSVASQSALQLDTAHHGSYWNPRLLHGFTLHMAGHGRCVNETLMLFDAAYARSRLREACTLDDQGLQQMAVEMLSTMGGEPRSFGVPPSPALTH